MAAVLAKGKTTITNAAKEPEVVDLVSCLKKMSRYKRRRHRPNRNEKVNLNHVIIL